MDNNQEEENDFNVYDDKYKIMLIGESSVGKSSILSRYTKNDFAGEYLTTLGIDFQDKMIEINNSKIRLQLWDTAGQERYRNLARNYFNTSNGFIIVFDVTSIDSFNAVEYWLSQINLYAPLDVKSVIVGNKIDLLEKRKVNKNDAFEMAEKNKFKYFECSAKTGEGVNDVFDTLAKEIFDSHVSHKKCKILNRTISISKDDIKNGKKKKCC